MRVTAGVGLGMVIFLLITLVISIVAVWKIFKKMGEPGWKSLIPYYSNYTMFKRVWNTKMFWVSLLVSFAGGGYVGASGYKAISKMSGADFLYGGTPVLSGSAATIGLMLSLVTVVITLILIYKLSKSFGHGFGFFFGLMIFPLIFILILAFGSSRYIGPNSKGEEEDDDYRGNGGSRERRRYEEPEEEEIVHRRRPSQSSRRDCDDEDVEELKPRRRNRDYEEDEYRSPRDDEDLRPRRRAPSQRQDIEETVEKPRRTYFRPDLDRDDY